MNSSEHDWVNALVEHFADLVATKLNDGRQKTGPQPRLLDVTQAALYIGRSPSAVRYMEKHGQLPCVRSDRRIFFDIRDLDRWIEDNKWINEK